MKMTIPVGGAVTLQASSTDAAPIKEVMELIRREEDRLMGPIVAPPDRFEQNVMQYQAALAFAINGIRAMLETLLKSIPEDEKAKLQKDKETLHTSGWS